MIDRLRLQIIFLITFFSPSLATVTVLKFLNEKLTINFFGLMYTSPLSYYQCGLVVFAITVIFMMIHCIVNGKLNLIELRNFYLNITLCILGSGYIVRMGELYGYL